MMIQNSVLDPQDQSKTSTMEDSNEMTIEFLRARLLSERSVSKSARQRADELAKKVMALEEQLRVVTLQRKMAEKATVEVLSILESQGLSDASEEIDFSSDLETPCDSGLSNDSASAKGGDRSNVDSSPAPSRSLSWKGRLHSSRSLEKYKTSNTRRRSSFSLISSSPKHRLGKSCRRLNHRETRSVGEESRDPPVNLDCQGNEAVSSCEGFPTGSNDGLDILRRESEIQEQDESALKLANKSHDVDGERENMEMALEHQARLIDQHEAMERAQREWEDKFRENNSNTPESCDMGNHSDVTEERDEGKAKTLSSARDTTSGGQENGQEPREVYLSEEMVKANPRDNMPKLSNDTSVNNHNGKTVGTPGFHCQENSPSLLKVNQEEIQQNYPSQPPYHHHDSPCRHGSLESKPISPSPTDVYGALPLKDAAGNKNSLSELVSHEQSHKISDVLESLKQAKLSLQQKIGKLPLVESGYGGKAIRSPSLVSKNEESGLPVGFSGLFRLPTDFSDETTASINFRDSTSGFSSNNYPGRVISRISDGHFGTNRYPSSSDDRPPLSTGYMESGSRFDTIRSPFPFYFSPIKYLDPTTFPTSPSYQNATPQPMSFGEGPSRPHSSSTIGVPPSYHFPYHVDHTK
ncbi:hypothetical protein Lalb_Chr03g0036371 [Lupinus albus]|uniref:Uncharacterized protein n=1 Tax=Lupinus albus TaxID=3870 RepID=A0A6A4QVN2_LUPAL|nr:hypothetical protein Lalb_Chr03g0036371 [Lupinus albus]